VTSSSTPLVFAIDVEPDDPEFPPGSSAPWLGFERCVDLFDAIRDGLMRATGAPVRLSWFLRMDPQIERGYGAAAWAAERYASMFDRLRQSGDEIGLHTHASRWDESASRWIADWGNKAWVDGCARSSFEVYQDAFGERCRAHRAGDRFMSNGLLAVLRELDVDVDLTVEPGMRGVPIARSRPHTADLPDMALVPRVQYIPSPTDWRRPSTDGAAGNLLMLPLASADPGPLLEPWRAAARKLRNVRRVRHRPLLPWAPDIGPRLWDVLARDVRAGTLTTLAFAMRSHTVLDEPSRNALLASVVALERHELASSLAFVTASEARNRSVSALVSSAGR
jgi:hypothetical protein